MSQTSLEIIQTQEPKLYEAMLLLPPNEQAYMAQVFTGWGAQGMEINMMLSAQKGLALSLAPTLPRAAADLPAAKAKLTELIASRKTMKTLVDAALSPLTKKFDQICESTYKVLLTESKNGNTGYIADLQTAIFPLEQERLKKERADQQKAQDLLNWRASCETSYNNQMAGFEKKVMDFVGATYKAALETKTPAEVPTYVAHLKQNMMASYFVTTPPTHSDPEFQKVSTDIFANFSAQVYIDKYRTQLDAAFVDFANAKNNAELAKSRLQASQTEATAKIDIATNVSNIGSLVAAQVSTPVLLEKSLIKEAWSIVTSKPMTWDEMICIMGAFIVNNKYCAQVIKVKDFDNLTVTQMKKALCDWKAEDVKFEVQGVMFKKVELI